MVIWYLVWNNPLKTSMSLSLCICQTSLWDSSLEGREKYLLVGFTFYPQKNLHPVANSSNKETNSTDFLTWSWHISIIFGWQANISQTSPQSTLDLAPGYQCRPNSIGRFLDLFCLDRMFCLVALWDVYWQNLSGTWHHGGCFQKKGETRGKLREGGGVVSHGIWSFFPELLYFCFKII